MVLMKPFMVAILVLVLVFGVVHVAFVGLLLVALVVGLCILCTNCVTGPTRVTLREWGGLVLASTRFGKIQLGQSTDIHQPSNSFCCPWLALNFDPHEASQTATWIWLRVDGLRYRL